MYWYVDQVFAAQLVMARGNSLRDLATGVAAVMAENLKERQREIELLALTPLFRRADLNSPDLLRSLERVQQSYPYYSWLGLAYTSGLVRVANNGLLEGASVISRPWFSNGIEAPFVGDLHEAVLLAKLLPQPPDRGPLRFIDFAAPVCDSNQKVRAVLGAHADWRWASDVVRVMAPQNARETRLEIFVVNAGNRIIFPDGAMNGSPIPSTVNADRPFMLDDWGGQIQYVSAMVPLRELTPGKPLG